MIMIVISFALVKFYAFAILYVHIVMQIKLVVVVVNWNVYLRFEIHCLILSEKSHFFSLIALHNLLGFHFEVMYANFQSRTNTK